MSLREEIRKQIFKSENTKAKRKKISFLNVDIEIRQPSVETILNMSNQTSAVDGTITKNELINVIINNVFVPGTKDKVFEEADYDVLVAMPMSRDFSYLVETMTELTNINIKVAEGN